MIYFWNLFAMILTSGRLQIFEFDGEFNIFISIKNSLICNVFFITAPFRPRPSCLV